jgi:hypothetical protein
VRDSLLVGQLWCCACRSGVVSHHNGCGCCVVNSNKFGVAGALTLSVFMLSIIGMVVPL